MNSRQRPVRSIDAFYEVNEPHAVSPTLAENLCGNAIEVVSRYTGPITVARVCGANLPLKPDVPVSPDKIRLGSAPHTVLLTRRPVLRTSGEIAQGVGRTMRSYGMGGSQMSRLVTSILPAAADLDSSRSTNLLIHEIGHTFDVKHCETDLRCIMQPDVPAGRPILCDDCAGELELAGYQNLAAQLPEVTTPPQQSPGPR